MTLAPAAVFLPVQAAVAANANLAAIAHARVAAKRHVEEPAEGVVSVVHIITKKGVKFSVHKVATAC